MDGVSKKIDTIFKRQEELIIENAELKKEINKYKKGFEKAVQYAYFNTTGTAGIEELKNHLLGEYNGKRNVSRM